MHNFEKKTQESDQKISIIEQKVVDVGLKYEHFQELFTNLIQEMHTTTENDEEVEGSNGGNLITRERIGQNSISNF